MDRNYKDKQLIDIIKQRQENVKFYKFNLLCIVFEDTENISISLNAYIKSEDKPIIIETNKYSDISNVKGVVKLQKELRHYKKLLQDNFNCEVAYDVILFDGFDF